MDKCNQCENEADFVLGWKMLTLSPSALMTGGLLKAPNVYLCIPCHQFMFPIEWAKLNAEIEEEAERIMETETRMLTSHHWIYKYI